MPQGPHLMDDLEALRRVLDGFAKPIFGLWAFLAFFLSFIAVMVNHQQLLFDEPLRLPAIDLPIDRPFYGVFLLGPVMFALVQFLLMGQLRLPAHRAARDNETILSAQIP